MNKIFIRVVLLLIVASLLIFILCRDRSPFGKCNSSFCSEPKEEITKIELFQQGRKLYLEKSEDKWLINGKVEARKSAVHFLESVLLEIQIKSPVSPDLFRKEITEKDIIPLRVKVFEKRKRIRSFLVYKTRSNNYGNIMKIKAGGKPFIVYMPGYEGDIGAAFTLNELFWQPYTLFNLLPSEISSVSFENLSDTASSFSIVMRENQFTLTGMKGWDSASVIRYLSYFTRVPFEAWAFDIGEEERRRIESQPPLYRIKVTTSEAITTVLTMWEKTDDETSAKDSDRLWGKTQISDELFVMRYFDIDPLIKKRSYFFH